MHCYQLGKPSNLDELTTFLHYSITALARTKQAANTELEDAETYFA